MFKLHECRDTARMFTHTRIDRIANFASVDEARTHLHKYAGRWGYGLVVVFRHTWDEQDLWISRYLHPNHEKANR